MTEHVPNMMYYERRRHKLDKCACLLYNTPLSFLIIHLIILLDNVTPSYNTTLDINLSDTSHKTEDCNSHNKTINLELY